MKTFALMAALVLSSHAFASGIETMKNVLDQVEVADLETKMLNKGFELTTVTDKYAQNGIRPRCICESFELAFTKNYPAKSVEKYSVVTTGFGRNLKVTINKVK